MSDGDGILEPILVHIKGTDVPQSTPEPMRARRMSFGTFTVTSTDPVMILARIPGRIRAVLTIIGQSTDVAYLCGSRTDAANTAGAVVMGLQVIYLHGTDEVWMVANDADIKVGVVSEFES